MPSDVLIVDDEAPIRAFLGAALSIHGLSYQTAHDGAGAIAALRREVFRAELLDLFLPDRNGVDVLQFLNAERPTLLERVIVMTGARGETLRDFDTSRIFCVIRKPFDVDELPAAIRRCVASYAHSNNEH